MGPLLLENIMFRVILLRIFLIKFCCEGFMELLPSAVCQTNTLKPPPDDSILFFASINWYWGNETSSSVSKRLPNSPLSMCREQTHLFISSAVLCLNVPSSAGQSTEGSTLKPAFCRMIAISSRLSFKSLDVHAR